MKIETIEVDESSELLPHQAAAVAIGTVLLDKLREQGVKVPDRKIGFAVLPIDRTRNTYTISELEGYMRSRVKDMALLVARRNSDYKWALAFAVKMNQEYAFSPVYLRLPLLYRLVAKVKGEIKPSGIVGILTPDFYKEMNALNP